MPMGFPAYAERTERFRGYSYKKLLSAADYVLEDLGWRPRTRGKGKLVASVPNEMYGIMMTWGAKFFVEIEEEELYIRSEGAFVLAWLDVGQHSMNINRFLNRLEDYLDDSR